MLHGDDARDTCMHTYAGRAVRPSMRHQRRASVSAEQPIVTKDTAGNFVTVDGYACSGGHWRSAYLHTCILATSGSFKLCNIKSTFLMVFVCVIFPSKFIFAFPQHNLLFFAPDSFSFHLCKTSPASINLFLPISSFDPCHICRSISTISTHVLHKNAWFQSSQASTSETIQLVIVLPNSCLS